MRLISAAAVLLAALLVGLLPGPAGLPPGTDRAHHWNTTSRSSGNASNSRCVADSRRWLSSACRKCSGSVLAPPALASCAASSITRHVSVPYGM